MAIDDYEYLEETGENITDNEELKVVFVWRFGQDMDGTNIYRIYVSKNYFDAWGEGWGEKPACNVSRELIMLDEEFYDYILELKTDIDFDLAQDCCCFSMQDSRDGIIPLAFENIDNIPEYPEPRIIIRFGDSVDTLERVCAKRDLTLRYV